MANEDLSLEELWEEGGFRPTINQVEAILHKDGPLYITAGPGAGKTKVLLWRTLNLIVFNEVDPKKIYLSTFTKKAANQLKEGLLSLLALVTNKTGQAYDISNMAVGTIHSNCQKVLKSKELPNELRVKNLVVMDEVAQYLYVNRKSFQARLFEQAGFESAEEAHKAIIEYFENKQVESVSRYKISDLLVKLFNRLTEEDFERNGLKNQDGLEQRIISIYDGYLTSMKQEEGVVKVDLSLLQQSTYHLIRDNLDKCGQLFDYLIIDEYQDTNPIQEKLLFALAGKKRNICVVGDDDQSLYRFRGATVENFVEFPGRCSIHLNNKPKRANLNTNFRSRKKIVDFYKHFMDHELIDWSKKDGMGYYRVKDKEVTPNNQDNEVAVIKTDPGERGEVAKQIAEMVWQLKESGKIDNYNQIAFLFPSLKTKPVEALKEALEKKQIPVYAPRAGRFMSVEDALGMFGCILHVLQGTHVTQTKEEDEVRVNFDSWVDEAWEWGEQMQKDNDSLNEFVELKRTETERVQDDRNKLISIAAEIGWQLSDHCSPQMLQALAQRRNISNEAQIHLNHHFFAHLIQNRWEQGRPVTLEYVVNRVTALDWSILDLFYQLCGFEPFTKAFKLAEMRKDEGPICNLALVSQYLARFTDTYLTVITAKNLEGGNFRILFLSYLRTLYHLAESEYEDEENPFPSGRVPFLTIHQAKGLEFPVVVLGSLYRRKQTDRFESLIRGLINREGEPLDRIQEFDAMRLFYVAMSRPQNLLILPHYTGRGALMSEPFKTILNNEGVPSMSALRLDSLPQAKPIETQREKIYSFTSDYLVYHNCPRYYMFFRKFGFVPSRTQTMFFGSLVHRTIEDIHRKLLESGGR